MKRFTFLLLIALITFFIVLWAKRPDIISNFWLWFIGLAGPIVAVYRRLKQRITDSDLYKTIFHHSESDQKQMNKSTIKNK
jgi:hypothetical protein